MLLLIFSFFISKQCKNLPSGYTQDITTSFADSTVECEGQAYKPLPDLPGDLPRVFLQVRPVT